MNPAFSASQLKSFLPLFLGYAEKVHVALSDTTAIARLIHHCQLVQKWREEEITPGNGGVESIVDVYSWFSRTTLDIIGEGISLTGISLPTVWLTRFSAGFGNHFNSLDNKKSDLSKTHAGLLYAIFILSKFHGQY